MVLIFRVARKPFIFGRNISGREQKDGDACNLRVVADLMSEGEAVHAGHQDIRDDDGRFLLGNEIECFLAIARGDDRVAAQPELHGQEVADVGDVFDDEDRAGADSHGKLPNADFQILTERHCRRGREESQGAGSDA